MQRIILFVIGVLFIIPLTAQHDTLAKTPPMGWNSYDCYGAAVNEAEVKANADVMANLLKDFGYEYIVVDYCWSFPYIGALDNPPQTKDFKPQLNMDAYGRLLPAVDRFPSSADGKGFKPLADYVHSKGLKFGIHIMRGIPRQATAWNTPIIGTNSKAAHIAEKFDTCRWLNHMYGIDISREGAQEYYNSLFKLYAEWEVDFVKIDDVLTPFHEEEIEAYYKAMKNCGRPMIISTSYGGDTPIEKAEFLKQNCHMWRISSDFWDDWGKLKAQFEKCHKWQEYIGAGHWPDADMIPIGRLCRRGPIPPERDSRFTFNEKQTLMSLWCISRSPLMIGGDLTMLYRKDMQLFRNKALLNINQHSENNRQLYRIDDKVVWTAHVPGSKEKYLAVFYLGEEDEVNIEVQLTDLGFSTSCKIIDLWNNMQLGEFDSTFSTKLQRHSSAVFRVEPLK
ncbi:MAG: glycoside hydrolase family 27 protein [Bacteroidales bacterium]|nr:glycoside hydrolase family 27 protein [Bacteroidales bacterium]